MKALKVGDGEPALQLDPVASSGQLRWRLLSERFAAGLLAPFGCAGCGLTALDPLGWNGSRRPLCDQCADPEVPHNED